MFLSWIKMKYKGWWLNLRTFWFNKLLLLLIFLLPLVLLIQYNLQKATLKLKLSFDVQWFYILIIIRVQKCNTFQFNFNIIVCLKFYTIFRYLKLNMCSCIIIFSFRNIKTIYLLTIRNHVHTFYKFGYLLIRHTAFILFWLEILKIYSNVFFFSIFRFCLFKIKDPGIVWGF